MNYSIPAVYRIQPDTHDPAELFQRGYEVIGVFEAFVPGPKDVEPGLVPVDLY